MLANKAPLALSHEELNGLATSADVGILYSAAFCGGLPVLNIVRRDMVCGNVLGFRGIFNGTTNFILEEMFNGRGYADALRETQERGIAEAKSVSLALTGSGRGGPPGRAPADRLHFPFNSHHRRA